MQYVKIEKKGNLAWVRFDRGERLNAFNTQLVKELTDVGRSFIDDLETQVIVVTGTDAYFSSGADLSDRTSRDQKLSNLNRRHLFSAGGRLCEVWENLEQITIAAISGLAVGAGIAFPLALDFRVIERGAYSFVPEVQLGTTLQWNTIPRLVGLVGPAMAKRIALMGERFSADEMLSCGLVDAVAEPGTACQKAEEWATALTKSDPVALRMVKRAITVASGALTQAVSFADSDQSMLTALLNDKLWALKRKDA